MSRELDEFTVREMGLNWEYKMSGLGEETEDSQPETKRVEEYEVRTRVKFNIRDYPDEIPEIDNPIVVSLARRRSKLALRHVKGGYEGKPITTKELWRMHLENEGECFYSGLGYSLGDYKKPLSLTVNRLDPSQGYTVDNTVLCCRFASEAKMYWDLEELLPLWKSLVSHLDSEG